ncbi:gluconokinase [Metabacillus schmidteae]|uniref:gluconokinase n=1 Tax=Metabacillus schmidteae TaxID=2730405 RepID=UPI001589CFF3|nr:gluconokinase [Metabacillus schmidteae]
MLREFVIGLDIGTTSVKAVVFEMTGKVVAEAEELISSLYPQQGWVEQDPIEIEQFAVKAVRDVIKKANIQKDELVTISFSSAMHSLVCIDEEYRPLSNGIIWADGRSIEQAEMLKEQNGEKVFQKTGVPLHPMTPLSKLLWMKEVGYKAYENASYFISIKEYILLKWFNKRVVDYSMATSTGLLNAHTLDWDHELMEMTGIKKEQLSEVASPTTVLRGLKKEIAEEMGVSEDLPFVLGSADGQLANLGIGAISSGEVAITAGTSGAIRQFTNGFSITDKRETFCYAFTEDYSIIGGPTNNGGIALQWLKELLNYEGSFDDFTKEAEKVDPGAEGLIFLPYINGERAPLWNQQAKGNFFGMSITHKKEHFVRAVLEGITFNIYQIGQSLESLAGAPEKIYVNGGLSRSKLWLQMLADIFGKEVYVSESHHSAAWGAAWTGLVALDKVSSFEEIKENIPMSSPIVPDENRHKNYLEIYKKYEALVKDIAKHF